MKIVVFGANGRVGSIVVREALERGYNVRAFIHGNNPFESEQELEIFQGDIYDSEQVEKAIIGFDAVISTLGSWGTPKKDILSTAMSHIIPAMQNHNIRRIISLTGAGAKLPETNEGFIQFLNRLPPLFVGRKVLNDSEKHLQLLNKSNLDWTVLRSPIMNNSGDYKKYKILHKCPLPNATINRKSVALAILDILENNIYIKSSPFIKRA